MPNKEDHAREIIKVYKDTVERISQDRLEKVAKSREMYPEIIDNFPETVKFEVEAKLRPGMVQQSIDRVAKLRSKKPNPRTFRILQAYKEWLYNKDRVDMNGEIHIKS